MINPREILTLHVGQAGVQLGNACWETMIAEHAVNVDGSLCQDPSVTENDAARIFFHESPSGRHVPRAVMIDTEPTVIDEIRTGFYRQLFHPDFLVSGIEDASNNFARGYYTIGRRMLYQILEKVRYIIESCDNFKGIMTYSGSGGGTGSGLYSVLLERVMLEYTGRTLFGTLILSGKTLNDSIVDPYNSILRLNHSISSDLNLLIDNESMYKICYDMLDILRPSYTNLNRLVSPILSSVTAPIRFKGPLTTDLSEISTNLIPFPRINFPTVCYSPFMTKESLNHSFLSSKQLLCDVFNQDHNLLNVNLQKGKFMSSVLTFRGTHQMNDVIEKLNTIKTNHLYEWVDWCPTGFKITQSLYPTITHFEKKCHSSLLMMCNHSEVTNTVKKVCDKFSILFAKRSFVHWFVGEGMEAAEMLESINNVNFLINDYSEICMIDKTKKANSKDGTYETVTPVSIKKSGDSEITSNKKFNKNKQKSDLFLKSISTENSDIEPEYVNDYNKTTLELQSNIVFDESSKTPSEIYQMNPKAKEIILQNVTSLTPETKQKMFGYELKIDIRSEISSHH